MNPMGMLNKMLRGMPGMGDSIAGIIKEMQTGTAMLLRTHLEMRMPMLGAMLKNLPQGTKSPLGEGFDADAPFMQMDQEVADLSTATVPDFTLPARSTREILGT
jgi:hypothetical protein